MRGFQRFIFCENLKRKKAQIFNCFSQKIITDKKSDESKFYFKRLFLFFHQLSKQLLIASVF